MAAIPRTACCAMRRWMCVREQIGQGGGGLWRRAGCCLPAAVGENFGCAQAPSTKPKRKTEDADLDMAERVSKSWRVLPASACQLPRVLLPPPPPCAFPRRSNAAAILPGQSPLRCQGSAVQTARLGARGASAREGWRGRLTELTYNGLSLCSKPKRPPLLKLPLRRAMGRRRARVHLLPLPQPLQRYCRPPRMRLALRAARLLCL